MSMYLRECPQYYLHHRRHLQQGLCLADGRAHLVLYLLRSHEFVLDLVISHRPLAVDLVQPQARHRFEQFLCGRVEELVGRIAIYMSVRFE